MKSREKPEPSALHVLARTLWHWDFVVSLIIGIVFGVVVSATHWPLIAGTGLFIAAVPLGAGIITGAVTSLRWASDRLKDAHVGQLMRVVDPTEGRFSLPYFLVVIAGSLTALVGILGIIVAESISYNWLVLLYSILLFLTLYDILGLFSLIVLSKRVQTMHSRLQADKESMARLERELKYRQNPAPDSPAQKPPEDVGNQKPKKAP